LDWESALLTDSLLLSICTKISADSPGFTFYIALSQMEKPVIPPSIGELQQEESQNNY
jgi:hypothetical protein